MKKCILFYEGILCKLDIICIVRYCKVMIIKKKESLLGLCL